MNARSQLWCLYSGYTFLPIYMIGFAVFSGFVPILPPSWDALQVTSYFEDNQTRLLIGQLICVLASAMLLPWAVAIFTQMVRIEEGHRTMSYLQLTCGAIGTVFFMVPSFVWLTMAFRTGHSPDTMLVLNDFAWIAWVVSWPPFALQAVAISACVFLGNKEQTLFPRWAAYASLWLGISMIPASLAVFFLTGPFAWNGIISVYAPMAVYLVWWHAIFIAVRHAIKS